MTVQTATMDGNHAVTHVAYRVNEVMAIYPITPSSPMAEMSDAWTAQGLTNIWGNVPVVQEMQAEGGAAGCVHGSLQSGALTTTFTAAQGLMLMLPNMYKIAGEQDPTVFHIMARALAAGASIFGDHQDIMAARGDGLGHPGRCRCRRAMTLPWWPRRRLRLAGAVHPFLTDGFRTSHEYNKLSVLPDEHIRAMIDEGLVWAHCQRALSPEHPVVRGTFQNPDTHFQSRYAVNPFYAKNPGIVQEAMEKLAGSVRTPVLPVPIRRLRLGCRAGGRQHGLRSRGGPRDHRLARAAGEEGGRKPGAAAQVLLRRALPYGTARERRRRLPCSTGTRASPAPSPSRCTPMWSACWRSRGQPASARPCRVSSAAGMGCPRKTLRRAWRRPCSTSSRKPDPATGSTVGIVDDVANTSLDYDRDPDGPTRGHGALRLLRSRRRRYGGREQE